MRVYVDTAGVQPEVHEDLYCGIDGRRGTRCCKETVLATSNMKIIGVECLV